MAPISVRLVVIHLLESCGVISARSAQEVLEDLSEQQETGRRAPLERNQAGLSRQKVTAGSALPSVFVLVVGSIVTVRLMFGMPSLPGLVITLIMAASIGLLAARAVERKKQYGNLRRLEFYLPIIMERIVMAVQAGHDILAGIRVVLSLDAGEDSSPDPISPLLYEVIRRAESGLSFEQSLAEVADSVPCAAVRHAFIHLAQAHKEGGELVMPLRELSDSTQLYYQESMEEEIAKMPVKATLPLLCTFTGLIIFFLTTPLLQVMEITAKAMPK